MVSTAPHLPAPSATRASRLVAALADDTGAATAEYAIATLAAVGLAGLLVVILRGDDVKGMLTDLIHRALTSAG
jgi:Flp pilus assembly pilin Flp